MDKLKMETPDLTQSNIEKLATLFPSCITEAQNEDGKLKKAVNFELLKQMLSDVVVETNRPICKTLQPYPEESVNWDTLKTSILRATTWKC